MRNKCKDCGKCCIETEMLLSQQDIDLIIKNAPEELIQEDFFFQNLDGLSQMKNYKNHCIFFNSKSKTCNIYKYRPKGCRFYPLIYNFEKNECTFDKDCPRTHLFHQNKKKIKLVCIHLKKFLKTEVGISLEE